VFLRDRVNLPCCFLYRSQSCHYSAKCALETLQSHSELCLRPREARLLERSCQIHRGRLLSTERPVDYFHVHPSPCLHHLVCLQQLKRPPGEGIIYHDCLSQNHDCRSKLDRNNDRNFYGRRETTLGYFASPLWHRSTIALDCTAVALSLFPFCFGFQQYLIGIPALQRYRAW